MCARVCVCVSVCVRMATSNGAGSTGTPHTPLTPARPRRRAPRPVCRRYDGTVRNAGGSVVQFLYGEDGMDGAAIEGQRLEVLRLKDRAFRVCVCAVCVCVCVCCVCVCCVLCCVLCCVCVCVLCAVCVRVRVACALRCAAPRCAVLCACVCVCCVCVCVRRSSDRRVGARARARRPWCAWTLARPRGTRARRQLITHPIACNRSSSQAVFERTRRTRRPHTHAHTQTTDPTIRSHDTARAGHV